MLQYCKRVAGMGARRMITFFVAGIPQPKGSTKSFLHRHSGRVVTMSDNDKLKGWQSEVKRCARLYIEPDIPTHGPVNLTLEFLMPRPKCHKTTVHHIKKPDADKLVRGIFDSLTGVAYHDDSQIHACKFTKRYVCGHELPGVMIGVII